MHVLHPAEAVATIVILLKKTALYIISAVMAPALWSAVDGVCAALRSDATFCADIHDTKADTSMVSAQAVSLTPVSVLRPPHKTGLLLPDSTTELSATSLVDSAVRTSHADTTAVDTAAVSHISDSLPRRPRRVLRRKVDLDNAVVIGPADPEHDGPLGLHDPVDDLVLDDVGTALHNGLQRGQDLFHSLQE